jgi:hypothetical protein
MLTRDDIHSDDDLLLYVEQAIGRAYRLLGKARTDRGDVARILSEHGAHSSGVTIAVEQYMRSTLPEPVYDVAEAQAAQRHLDDLAARGYSADVLARSAPGAHRGGGWTELRKAEIAYANATRGLDAHAGALEAAVASWWRSHASAIDALCDKHAGLLLAARVAS